jgi:hypothetical protein
MNLGNGVRYQPEGWSNRGRAAAAAAAAAQTLSRRAARWPAPGAAPSATVADLLRCVYVSVCVCVLVGECCILQSGAKSDSPLNASAAARRLLRRDSHAAVEPF